MIKKSYLFIFLSGFVITDVWCAPQGNPDKEEEEIETRTDNPPPFEEKDLIKKTNKHTLPHVHPQSFAWYAPTALAGGLLLNNLASFQIKPACAFALIGIAGGFLGQRFLDKNKNLKTGLQGERKERTQNFIIGGGLKSIGWLSTAVAFNGFVNYILKKPLFFHVVQALDKLVITPDVFIKAPELAQLCQNNHLIAAGAAVLSVGLAGNYFLSKESKTL